MSEKMNRAHFGDGGNHVVVESLVIGDKNVVREAQHRTSGTRGRLR